MRSVLKIGKYSCIFPSFSLGMFSLLICLDQSHASENIWWIISCIKLYLLVQLIPFLCIYWEDCSINFYNNSFILVAQKIHLTDEMFGRTYMPKVARRAFNMRVSDRSTSAIGCPISLTYMYSNKVCMYVQQRQLCLTIQNCHF